MKKITFCLLSSFSGLFGSEGSTDIYLAGPLFTLAERQFNATLAEQLRKFGYSVHLPQDEEPREFTTRAVFELDVQGIDQSQLVVAIMDGPDPDSGTCFECGYAYAKGKPILAVRTDFRSVGEGGISSYNLMLSEAATKRISLSSLQSDLDSVVQAIAIHVKELLNK